MLREVDSGLSAADAAALSDLRTRLLNQGFCMLLRSYREAGRRTGTLEFDRKFAIEKAGDLLEGLCLNRAVRFECIEAAIGSAATAVLVKHNILVRRKGMLRARDLRLIDHFGV